MRILHTADWHPGKSLHGQSLLEDQVHILDQLLDIARDQKHDAVLLSGAVYERSGEDASLSREDLKQDDLSLFRSFFTQVTGEELAEDQAAAFRSLANAAGDVEP